ncbi:MAG: hypothetical protein AAGB46_20140, partial [Verrucomicrobiota bacterium]
MHEHFTLVIENQNVHRSMHETLSVHLRARELFDYVIVFVDDIENIFLHAFSPKQILSVSTLKRALRAAPSNTSLNLHILRILQ